MALLMLNCELHMHFKDWPAKKVTIFNTTVHLGKLQTTFWFLACILHDYVADEITKEF